MEFCPLCKLHAALVYYQYNLRLLHWKIGGSGFEEGHLLMDEYAEKFSSFIDKVGELILSTGEQHSPGSLEDIIKCLEEDDDKFIRINPSSIYNIDQVFEYTNSMFKQIFTIAYNARDEVVYDIASELDSIIYWFRIETMYKLKHKLMKTK